MRLSLLFVALVAVGCGSSSGSSSDLASAAGDLMMSSPDMFSACGHPGDTGNSKGVGKYCTDTNSDMCKGQTANICSTLMPTTLGPVYFCTLPCDPSTGAPGCGENASCTCLSPGACGCVPDSCRVGLFG